MGRSTENAKRNSLKNGIRTVKQVELIECRKEGQFVHSRTIPETIAEYTESLALFSKKHPRGSKR